MTQPAELPIRNTTTPRRPSRWACGGRAVLHLIGWAGLIGLIVLAARKGLRQRQDIWPATESVRFVGDIANGFAQGNRVLQNAADLAGKPPGDLTFREFFHGFVATYDRIVADNPDGNFGLDYTPTRLLAMSLWVRHLQRLDPTLTQWNRDYATTAPLLRFNLICEITSVIAMWALLRYWRRQRDQSPLLPRPANPWREWPAVLAGLAVWLNPTLIWNAHAWPQWDVWLIPFFLLAILAGSMNRWLAAGFICAIGASFKGQVLMVMPVLILWPIVQGKVLAGLRFIIGAGLFTAIMVSPWLAHEPLARWWIAGVLVAAVVVLIVLRRGPFSRWTGLTAGLMVIASLMVVARSPSWSILGYAVALAGGVIASGLYRPRGSGRAGAGVGVVLAMVATAAVFLAGRAFEGRWSWYAVGYEYPTRHYPQMAVGTLTNVPSLLAQFGRWRLNNPAWTPPAWRSAALGLISLIIVGQALWGAWIWRQHRQATTLAKPYRTIWQRWTARLAAAVAALYLLPWGQTLTIREVLIGAYLLVMILCAIGAATQATRRDPRLLLALCTPWLVMFILLPQMHERYLLWAAVTMSCGFGLGVGPAILSILITAFAWGNMANTMLQGDPQAWQNVLNVTNQSNPAAAWALAMIAATCVCLSLTPARRREFTNSLTQGEHRPPRPHRFQNSPAAECVSQVPRTK